MDHVTFDRRPHLERPIVVTAFSGWNDAGEAASLAAQAMIAATDAEPIGRIDPEEFFDFQAARPTVHLVDGRTRSIGWPGHAFSSARVAERDLIFLTGPEPNLRWRTFSHAVIQACRDLGASRFITLGAFLADIPHRREVPIVGSASDPDDAEGLDLRPSNYEGPTGIVGVAHDVAARAGLPTISLWAAVPHYLPMGENPKAALALATRCCDAIGITLDLGRLERTTSVWEATVAEHLEQNADLARYVDELENGGSDPDLEQADGEEIAAEIERFLRGDA